MARIDGAIERGTRAIFVESFAPRGWALDATIHDRLLRVVSASPSSGGDWTISGIALAPHALTVAEIPSHDHATETGSVAAHEHAGTLEPVAGHTHGGTVNSAGSHAHGVTTHAAAAAHTHTVPQSGAGGAQSAFGSPLTELQRAANVTNSAGAHSHAVATSSDNSHTHASTTDPGGAHSHDGNITIGDHAHTINVGSTGGGAAHGHSFTTNASWRPSYVDTIVAQRVVDALTLDFPLLPAPGDSWERWTAEFASGARLTFDNVSDRLAERVNTLAYPGVHMIFASAAAPAGWRQTAALNDRVFRVVNGPGAGLGGSWEVSGVFAEDHTLTTDELPPHSHSATMASAGGHTHVGVSAAAGNHQHSTSHSGDGAHAHDGQSSSDGGHAHSFEVAFAASAPTVFGLPGNANSTPVGTVNTSSAGAHTHAVSLAAGGSHGHGYVTAAGGAHQHSLSTTTATHSHSFSVAPIGGGLPHGHPLSSDSSWRPAYLDVLVCEKVG